VLRIRVRCFFDSGIRIPNPKWEKNPDPGLTSRIIRTSESLQTIFRVKITYFNSGIRDLFDPGSGMEKLGSGIRSAADPDPTCKFLGPVREIRRSSKSFKLINYCKSCKLIKYWSFFLKLLESLINLVKTLMVFLTDPGSADPLFRITDPEHCQALLVFIKIIYILLWSGGGGGG
jgi:hypothetical protein